MPSNALKYLLQGFQSSYNRAAQGYEQEQQSQNVLNREIALQSYKDRLKQQQEQQAIQRRKTNLEPLLRGTFSSEEQSRYLSGLSEKDIEEYGKIKTLTAPKTKQKTVGQKVFQTDEYGNIDFSKPPIYEIPQKPEKPQARLLGTYYDSKTDSWKAEHGIPITETEKNKYPMTKKIGEQLYGITSESGLGKAHDSTGNGDKILSKISKTIYQADFNKQQKYLSALSTISEDSPESQQWKKELTSHNQAYVSKIKNNMPDTAKNWYKEAYNVKDESGQLGNPPPEEYWNNLVQDYINGKLGKSKEKKQKDDVLDFQYLHELFRATYGFDPITRYGLGNVGE